MRSARTSGTGSARCVSDHDPVAVHFAARQREDVPDHVVNVEPVLVGGGVLGEGAYPGDDFASALAVGHDPHDGLPGALQVLRGEPAHAGIRAIHHGTERLIDFMGDRGRQLAQRRQPRHVRQLCLRLAQGFLGALAFNELTELAADAGHHVEQVLVGLADLTADEIDDAEDLAAKQDRKGEGRVQPFTRGDARAEEGWVMHDIRNARGCMARPDLAWQPTPRPERARPGGGLELRGLDRRLAPHLRAA